jgi:hypothetical protein
VLDKLYTEPCRNVAGVSAGRPGLDIQQKALRIFEVLFHTNEKCDRLPAIDESMVV